MTILVTGGAGYIGSHTLVELLGAGQQVVVLDNLSNSSPESLKRVEQITGKEIAFYKCDLLDIQAIEEIFQQVSGHGQPPLGRRVCDSFIGCLLSLPRRNWPLSMNRRGSDLE